mgnify:CR=1 FL=1
MRYKQTFIRQIYQINKVIVWGGGIFPLRLINNGIGRTVLVVIDSVFKRVYNKWRAKEITE